MKGALSRISEIYERRLEEAISAVNLLISYGEAEGIDMTGERDGRTDLKTRLNELEKAISKLTLREEEPSFYA